jgi:LPXTG-motif cell wall-anchored protein
MVIIIIIGSVVAIGAAVLHLKRKRKPADT